MSEYAQLNIPSLVSPYAIVSKNVKIGKKFVSEFKELGLPLGDIKNVKEFMENARIRTDLDNLNSRLLKSLPR